MDEITRRVYECQKRHPTQGNWCETVREDFKKVGLHMTDEHVSAMDSDTYENMIKNTIRGAALKDLELIKEAHSKLRKNLYIDLKSPQEYLTGKTFTTQERSIIFGLKSRTIRGIKLNFKNQYTENTLCPICERVEDTQEHVGCCPVLLGIKPQATPPLYENIYGNVHQQKEVAQIYLQLLQLCDELLAGGTDRSTLPGVFFRRAARSN